MAPAAIGALPAVAADEIAAESLRRYRSRVTRSRPACTLKPINSATGSPGPARYLMNTLIRLYATPNQC